MLLYSFLVYDTHLVPCFANAVLAFSSSNITVGGMFHVGVNVFVMVIGCAGVTAQAKTVSGHKYQRSIFLANINSVSEELQPNLWTCLIRGAQKIEAHLAHCGQFAVNLWLVQLGPVSL